MMMITASILLLRVDSEKHSGQGRRSVARAHRWFTGTGETCMSNECGVYFSGRDNEEREKIRSSRSNLVNIIVDGFLLKGQHVQGHGGLFQSTGSLLDRVPLAEEESHLCSNASLVNAEETKPNESEQNETRRKKTENENLQRGPIDVVGEEDAKDRRDEHPEDDDGEQKKSGILTGDETELQFV